MSEILLSDLLKLDSTRPLVVTGTDTEVGKTYVAALLIRQLVAQGIRVGVYKPVASGCQQDPDGQWLSEDAAVLWRAAGCPATLQRVCPQAFAAPLAPPTAAALEGRQVDSQLMIAGAEWWRSQAEFLVVEGAGGLLSPLSDDMTTADLAKQLDAQLVIVIANRLGAINHARLTVACAESKGLEIRGLIVNDVLEVADDSTRTNAAAIAHYCRPPLVAVSSYRGGLVYSSSQQHQ